MTTINFWPDSKLSYPPGTTLHILYFTSVHKNTPFLGQDRSWHLDNLLYHVLRVSYYSHLAKNHFIAAKNIHISNILLVSCAFTGDSPMCWCHSLVLAYMSENSRHLHVISLTILLFLAYQVTSSPGRDPWMPHLVSVPGICLPLTLN